MQPQTRTNKLSAEQRRRLDRQRFIGLQTQQKLLNSLVLITPANGPNTQLAKNLVLAGVNVAIFDDALISHYDIETNFLIAHDELGLKRAEAVYNRLKEMNPNGKNQYYLRDLTKQAGQLTPQFLSRFTIVCTSTVDFNQMQFWDNLTKKANKPYYNLVSCGYHAFAYISLGNQYSYREPLTKKSPKIFTIPCLDINQCIQQSKKQLIGLKKKSSKKQYDMLQAILMINQSRKIGLSFNIHEPTRSEEDMLFCTVELGEELRENIQRNFLLQFARLYGVDYCPVYSVLGSIVSQQIIKVVQNQQQPAVNWLVFNSEGGYACVLKLKQQQKRISSDYIQL